MSLQKTRWSKAYESAEEELEVFLAARSIKAARTSIAPGETAEWAATSQSWQLWCAEGSMNFAQNDQPNPLSLQAGDSLRLGPGSQYQATAGINGCVYYQIELP